MATNANTSMGSKSCQGVSPCSRFSQSWWTMRIRMFLTVEFQDLPSTDCVWDQLSTQLEKRERRIVWADKKNDPWTILPAVISPSISFDRVPTAWTVPGAMILPEPLVLRIRYELWVTHSVWPGDRTQHPKRPGFEYRYSSPIGSLLFTFRKSVIMQSGGEMGIMNNLYPLAQYETLPRPSESWCGGVKAPAEAIMGALHVRQSNSWSGCPYVTYSWELTRL